MLSLGTRKRDWLALVIFLVFVLLYGAGARPLNDPDEGRYANIAHEALESDHPWWEPQLSDVGHYDKPPLLYWVTAVSYRLFGINEWGARVPSLMGVLLTLAGLGWAAYRLYGMRAAWTSVLVGGTTLQLWLFGRILTPDMLLTGWCTLAVAAWLETKHRHNSWAWWLVQVALWTLAGWTKATPTLVPLLGLVIYVYASQDGEGRRALRLPLLLPLIVLLSLPWYALVLYCHPQLVHFFLHRELYERITGQIAGRAGPIYYYLPICLGGFLPWWPLALAAYIRQRQQWEMTFAWWRSHLTLDVCILVTGLVVFSLIGSKHATYTLPFVPWAALGMTRLLMSDKLLSRPAAILLPAGASAAIYLIIFGIAYSSSGAWENRASVRGVAAFLHHQNASAVYSDHFWPSLEIYWGEKSYFTDPAPMEITDPVDEPTEHFGYSNPAPQPGAWFIHFKGANDSCFEKWLDDPRVHKTVIGNFVVGPLSENGAAPIPARQLHAPAKPTHG